MRARARRRRAAVARAARLHSRSARNAAVASSAWKLDSGCPPRNCSAGHRGQAAPASRSGLSHEPVGQQQHPRHQRPDAHVRIGDPGDHPEAERRRRARRAARPPKRMPSARPSRNMPNAATHSLSTAIQPERRPERQHVGGQREGREDRRLGVGQERPPADDVGVPERDVRHPLGARSAGTAGAAPGASPSSVLLGGFSSAGLTPAQGGWNQSMSEFDSVLPGSSAGPTNTTASTA